MSKSSQSAVLVGLLLLCVLPFAGCRSVAGSSSPAAAAKEFFAAAAAGNVGQAQSVSLKPVTAADLDAARKALFGADSPLKIEDIQVLSDAQSMFGSDSSTYFALDAYTVDGSTHRPDFTASSLYQIAVEKRGDSWVVVSWTGPIGKVR